MSERSLKIFVVLIILFLVFICVSLVYLFYVLMNIDAIYNIKSGDILYVINELNKYSVRIMFFLSVFVIILLMIITMAFVIMMFFEKDM
jgi:hypothetical protein